MKVIVTGAAGWIGQRVCSLLKQDSHTVIAIDLVSTEGSWDEFHTCNIADDESVKSLLDCPSLLAADALIHCAGYAHRPIETAEEKERFLQINDLGTKRVINIATQLKVLKFLYVSSIAFYNWDKESLKREEDELCGLSAYAKSKLSGEEHVKSSSLDFRVVRLSTVYGDGDRANFSKLATALKNKRFLIPGYGTALKSVVSIDMAAEIISQFSLLDHPKYRLINVGYSEAPSLLQITNAFSSVCHFPQSKRLARSLFSIAAFFGDILCILKPNFPLNSKNLKKLSTSTAVDVSRMLELFPKYRSRSFEKDLLQYREFYKSE